MATQEDFHAGLMAGVLDVVWMLQVPRVKQQ